MQHTLKLEHQLCFALYSASRAMNHAYTAVLEPLGLSYTQYLVLLVLWEEQRLTVGQLGERLGLDSGTLSPVLKRMEAARFVTKQRDPTDERVVQIGLTVQGQALKALAVDIPETMTNLSGLTTEQTTSLHRILLKLTSNLDQKPLLELS